MTLALAEARKAAAKGEAPVGCVIVRGTHLVAAGHNLRQTGNDPTAHAEVVALRRAGSALGTWNLSGLTLYVTLEPCPMCAGALVNSRISRVVYGCADPKAGAVESLFSLLSDQRLNHRPAVTGGVLAAESSALLSSFFKALRGKGVTVLS